MLAFFLGTVWMVFTPMTFGKNWAYHIFYLWALYLVLWWCHAFTSVCAESFRIGDLTGIGRGLRWVALITRAPWLTYLVISILSLLPWFRSFLMLSPLFFLVCLQWAEFLINKAVHSPHNLAREGELHVAGQVNAERTVGSNVKPKRAWLIRQAITNSDAAPDFTTVKRPAKTANASLFDDLEPAQVPGSTEARGSTQAAKKPADASTVAASLIAFLTSKPKPPAQPEVVRDSSQPASSPATDQSSSLNPRLARRAHLNAPNSSQTDTNKATGER